jgi:hypothetical protein
MEKALSLVVGLTRSLSPTRTTGTGSAGSFEFFKRDSDL